MQKVKATIRKIHPLKLSRNGNSFMRIDFELEDGRFAKTDLCPNYRNFSRWKQARDLGVGTAIANLQIRRDGKPVEINADSYPEILRKPLAEVEKPKPSVEQGKLL